MIPWLAHLPWWADALPWCVLVLLIGAMAPCWPWWDDDYEDDDDDGR